MYDVIHANSLLVFLGALGFNFNTYFRVTLRDKCASSPSSVNILSPGFLDRFVRENYHIMHSVSSYFSRDSTFFFFFPF